MSFEELIKLLWAKRKIIVAITLVTFLFGIIKALTSPVVFSSQVSFLPPQQEQSPISSMMGLLNAGGVTQGVGLKNPNDMYIAILKSRKLTAIVVEKLKLKEYYEVENNNEAVEILTNNTEVVIDKNGLFLIKIKDSNSEKAAFIANAFVDNFKGILKSFSVSEATARREYFEKKVAESKNDLNMKEDSLRHFQEETGVVSASEQMKITLEDLNNLRSLLIGKQTEISAALKVSTENSPVIIKLRAEQKEIQKQIDIINSNNKGNVVFTKKDMPLKSLKFLRITREIKYREEIYSMVLKQYELALLDETKEGVSVRILDKAVPSKFKDGPKKILILAVSIILGMFLSVIWVFAQPFIVKVITIVKGEEYA